jgi:mono/diheme cytochrome c family protein
MKLLLCAEGRDLERIVLLFIALVFPWSSMHASHVAEDVRSAPMLYAKHCAKCHKTDGTGSKNLSTPAPDFTRTAWQRDRTDFQLRVSIRDGKGHAMPSFVERFSDKELKALTAHVRGFAPTHREEGASLPAGEFDARFRELELELAEMRREFWKLHVGPKQKEPKPER